MHRRTFLFHGTAAAAALLAGCSSAHSPEPDGARPDAGATHDGATHDGGPLFADATTFRDAALGGALVIAAPFRVLLNDTTCSHNGHTCFVEPGSWDEDEEISFLGGSHEVRFWVSELVLLQGRRAHPLRDDGRGAWSRALRHRVA